MEPELARRVIEQLRSGVPSREVAAALPFGRVRLFSDFEEDLEKLKGGTRGRNFLVLVANYGDGKTHALQGAWHAAEKRNFLVSALTVSRETPLDRTDRVYRKIILRTYAPGVGRSGLDPLLREIGKRPEDVQRLLRFSERELHPKVHLALEARFEGRGGQGDVWDEDLAGYFHTVGTVRQKYRESFRKAPQVPKFVMREHSFDYFRLVDELTVTAGLSGWVILVDELEMLARLGKRARALSYAFLAKLTTERRLPHTYSVWALASSFQTDLLEAKDEAAKLPEWLVERGAPELAAAVADPIHLLSSAPVLPPLKEEDLVQTFSAIVASHGMAYGWNPSLDGRDLLARIRKWMPERDVKVRQLVRAAVQFLDILCQHGEEPDLRLTGVDAPLEVSEDDEEPPAGEGVLRTWADR